MTRLSERVGRALDTLPAVLAELQQVVRVENPWLRYFEGTRPGYAVLELTLREATGSADAVDSVTEPVSPAHLLCSVACRPGGQA